MRTTVHTNRCQLPGDNCRRSGVINEYGVFAEGSEQPQEIGSEDAFYRFFDLDFVCLLYTSDAADE